MSCPRLGVGAIGTASSVLTAGVHRGVRCGPGGPVVRPGAVISGVTLVPDGCGGVTAGHGTGCWAAP